jgi:hypothetical protein
LQSLSRRQLDERIRQEIGIADMQRLAAAPHADIVIDDDIEELARSRTETTE